MQSLLDTDGKADDFGALLGALATKPALFEDDVQRIRHVFYRQGAVDRRSAAQIFHANRVMRASNDCWTEFYLEALAEFFLDAQRDGLVLPADKETALLTWLGDGISLVDLGER
ncbi:MAG: hypothetical protein OEU92_14060, partial [Alphaproteobacteria bacterium]|nr:hypothetical protein [Alphaproteobacteria bacterium]